MASMLQFRVECKKTKPGQAVYVVGSVPELGSWKVDQGALEALARNFIFPRPTSHVPWVSPFPASNNFKYILLQFSAVVVTLCILTEVCHA